jgi:hypothetical protein
MGAIEGVLGDMVDHDRLMRVAHMLAHRGFDLELATGLKAEPGLVVDGKANPALLRHTCDGRKIPCRLPGRSRSE